MKKFALTLLIALTALNTAPSHAALVLFDKDDWKVGFSGFVELDMISDSTRSFNEITGNAPVERPTGVAGQLGRTLFSIRNSRLAFTVDAPKKGEWKGKAHIEGDFLGFNPAPGTGGQSTESGLITNATFRVRHAFFQADHTNGWQVMAGQNWSLLGFQPFYFLGSAQVAPLPGSLYARTTQARVTKTTKLSDENALQVAMGVTRPPQRDANLPGFQAGARMALGARAAAAAGGASEQKTQPMSFAVTGDLRQFVTPKNFSAVNGDSNRHAGWAFAVDGFLPVLASKDGKDVSNTLALTGEFTMGSGYGDEMNNWTGNMATPLNSSTNSAVSSANLDAGIGDLDTSGLFHLVNLKTFNAQMQYHLPASCHTWFTLGYGRLYSDNMSLLTNALLRTSGNKIAYNRAETYFGNIFYDLTSQIRVAFEYAHARTQYADAVIAHNNRYQVSTWFRF